jgi:hypothetical protein
MGSSARKHATGRIAVVQEERFRLISDDGQGLLLTLSHKAQAGPEQMCRWHQQGTEVRVDYVGEPNLSDGVAMEVRPA